ncbi:MAG: right-handed parallel beta-helix repeat-containing protein, partial [Myxococcales bacterium]|nr:right-handed parallel beta-helix repeat-containing protein [Myxococcales bacterium]
EGQRVSPGDELAVLEGNARALLAGERTALNLMQNLSGVATLTRAFVDAAAGKARICDTRKTTPGLRRLQRYAVRCGGGHNHRNDLSAGVLIKENHIRCAGGVEAAVRMARKRAPHPLRIECEVTDFAELDAALGSIGDGRAVLVLADGTYNVTMQIGGTAEIAILGSGGSGAPILAGAGIRVVDSFGDSILYFDGVQIVNASGLGVACGGTSVWLDDSAVRNNIQLGMDISGACNAHLRRSLVLANNSGGVDMAGGSLTLRNSVVGLNGNQFTSLLGGIGLNGATVDITYTTIVANQAANAARGSVFCAGGESGEIRNSIIAGTGNSVDGCAGLTFRGNAVDDPDAAAAGAEVGPAMATWFVDLGMNDFHLSSTGADVLLGIALWQKGDPTLDIDGEAIPTDMPSFPGYDQP